MKHTDARIVVMHDDKNTGEENRTAAQLELIKRGWTVVMGVGLWSSPDNQVSCTFEAAVLREKLDVPMEIRIFS